MRNVKIIVVLSAGLVNLASSSANASGPTEFVYTYTGTALTAYVGSSLKGAHVNFEFTTTNKLPPNITFTAGQTNPTFSVPVLDWSISASGWGSSHLGTATVPNLSFLLFDTDAGGNITGWYLFDNAFNGSYDVTIASQSPNFFDTAYGSASDFAQTGPLNGPYSDFGLTITPGTWVVAPRSVPVQGGGATTPYYEYSEEITGRNDFAAYLPNVGSASGLAGFLRDDFSCVYNKSGNTNNGNCSGTYGGVNAVDYAASDSPLRSEQIAAWATSAVGQGLSGNLIQVPSMGFGVAIAVVNASVTENGRVTFSDSNLCGIFSGAITDFSQIADLRGKLTRGPITIAYDSTASEITFALTNHLEAVCTTQNSAIKFTATTNFASLFSTVPSNFIGLHGTVGVASYLANASGGTTNVTSAIGYLTPDYTSLIPVALLLNGTVSPLRVADLFQGQESAEPNESGIAKGLQSPLSGSDLSAPTNAADAANPALWAPLIAVTRAGYPIVGYTFFDVAQCYSRPEIKTRVVELIKEHYNDEEFWQRQKGSGFVPMHVAGGGWYGAVLDNIVENKSGWNVNIGNATACAGVTGR